MNLLEIIMLIIGIFTIIMSCRIVARPDKENDRNMNSLEGNGNLFTKEGLESFRDQQNEILSSASDEAIARTDDYLSKLSNEKIMAVSEYSEQIIEKITRNHEEVVFLYNMLNNKEKDLKDTLMKHDSLQIKEQETIIEDQAEAELKNNAINPKQLDMQAENIRRRTSEYSLNQFSETDSKNQPVSFNNAEILELYRQGKSILDISKQLGIGQGEVKLVVDLFKDR